jgi:NADP-reducing hydrogenase subunit HndD
MIDVTIDGRAISVEEHTSILAAAQIVGVRIPTLCFLKDINDIGACRACVVEVEGADRLVAACNTEVTSGMVVRTATPRVVAARRTNVELLLSQHDIQCASCIRGGSCALQRVAGDLGITDVPFEHKVPASRWNEQFPLIRDASRCIKCLRCIQVCDEMQAVHVWDLVNSASRTDVGVAGCITIEESKCTLCGQCITHCPTGALHERDDTARILDALADPDRICLVQIAPAVRAAWGESLGLERGQASAKRLVAALRRVGFDHVFDTNFSADLTIMEEGSEFLARLKDPAAGKLPLFTSCCPGWIRYIKGHYPAFVDNLSTAKSPQQMFGAVAKSYYAELLGVDPQRLFLVSIMPCLAKKHECALENMRDAGAGQDVDASLTTREIDRMIRATGVDVTALAEEEFDAPLGTGTGAAVIFGATGGVMEAALRSAYFLVTGSNPEPDAFKDVRGLDGWKEATFDLAGTPLRVAVVSGLGNTERLMDALVSGEVAYDFIEVMACPGGCAGGGGQPIAEGCELAGERGGVLYGLDAVNGLRFSHENPSVLKCYEDYFGAPLSERSHHLLHSDHHDWNMPHV